MTDADDVLADAAREQALRNKLLDLHDAAHARGHSELDTSDDPSGTNETLAFLDGVMATSRDPFTQAHALLLRAVVRAGYRDPSAPLPNAMAESAAADYVASARLLVDGSLSGDATDRFRAGWTLARAFTVLLRSDAPGPGALERPDQEARRWLELGEDDPAVQLSVSSLAARAAARWILEDPGDAGDPALATILGFWTERAAEQVSQLLGRDDQVVDAEACGQAVLAFAWGFCAQVAHDAEDADGLRATVRCLNRAWPRFRQAEALAHQIQTDEPNADTARWFETCSADGAQAVAQTFIARIANTMAALGSEATVDEQAGLMAIVRSILVGVSSAAWDRSVGAGTVIARSRDRGAHLPPDQRIAGFLDAVELSALSMVLMVGAYGEPVDLAALEREERGSFDEEEITRAVIALVLTEPPASDGHLAATLAIAGGSSEPEALAAAGEAIAEARTLLLDAGVDASADSPLSILRVRSAGQQALLRVTWSPDEAEAALADLVGVVRPLLLASPRAPVTSGEASLFATVEQLAWELSNLDGLRTAQGATALIGALRDLRRDDAGHEIASPHLDAITARLAYLVAQRDASWYDTLLVSSRRYNDAMAQDRATDPLSQVLHVETLRTEAVAILMLAPSVDDGTRAVPSIGAGTLARLHLLEAELETYADASIPELGSEAQTARQEVAMLRGAPVDPLDFTDGLLDRRPMSYLRRLLDLSDLEQVADVRNRIDRAVEGLILHTRRAGAVSPLQLTHLDTMTSAAVAERLGLAPAVRLRLAGLVEAHLVEPTPAAGQLHIQVAYNLLDLLADPGTAVATASFVERAGRWLPLAVDAGSDPRVVLFMVNRSGAALNFGALTASELRYRLSVAIAAVLLASQMADLDLMAHSAYAAGELFLAVGLIATGVRWHDYVAQLIAAGALADPANEPLRRAMAADAARIPRVQPEDQ